MSVRQVVPTTSDPLRTRLAREISLLGLLATAFGAMIGIGINVLPFMVQRSQPGVGDYVPLAYLVAAVPASLAALCYAMLASAMPRAGGSYVNATRALDPFAGFLASFAQWFGLSIGMGVVAYLMVTWAIYHAVPWQYIQRESLVHDVSAPGLLSLVLPRWAGLAVSVERSNSVAARSG